jgi:hypothetical protein
MPTPSEEKFSMCEYVPGELGDLEKNGWFAYDGYNPSETLAVLRESEPDEELLMKEIKTCAFFTMHRGNKPGKAALKMSEEGRKLLTSLMTKYNIIQTAPKSKRDVTMVRIAGIMPLYCAQVAGQESTRLVGAKPDDLPKCLTFPSAPSLIPMDREDLYSSWLKWALNFNQVIAQGKNSDKVDFFGRVIQRASYLTEQQKIIAMKSLSVPGF